MLVKVINAKCFTGQTQMDAGEKLTNFWGQMTREFFFTMYISYLYLWLQTSTETKTANKSLYILHIKQDKMP